MEALSPTGQDPFNRPLGYAKETGDLSRTLALDVVEGEHDALLFRKGGDQCGDGFGHDKTTVPAAEALEGSAKPVRRLFGQLMTGAFNKSSKSS